ncbi:MAG: hypothetical protein ACXVB9_05855 [Bdellovibrionota bacterium]
MRFLSLLVFLLATTHAHAARISLVGAANSSTPNSPGVEYTAETAYGYGVLLETRMIPFFGFEIGALYAPRKFTYSTAVPSATTVTATAKVYEFPALLRFHLGRTFSFGMGGYYASGKGDIGVETNANGTTTSQSVTYASQNQTNSDYGLLGSIAFTMRLGPLTHLVFDGRYLAGLKNNSTIAGSDRKYNDLELLAGLQFGF